MKNTSNNVSVPHEQGIHASESIVINRPASIIYNYWHNFEQIPNFMENIDKVQQLAGGQTHWIAKAPLGTKVEWDAEVINDVPNEVIGWRSLEGSQIPNAGSVRFSPQDAVNTEVRLEMEYMPPAGKLGQVVAALFGQEPGQQLKHNLEKLKDILETQIITS